MGFSSRHMGSIIEIWMSLDQLYVSITRKIRRAGVHLHLTWTFLHSKQHTVDWIPSCHLLVESPIIHTVLQERCV